MYALLYTYMLLPSIKIISQQLTHKNDKNKHMSIHKDYKSISKVVLLAIHYPTQTLEAR